jgi:C1A family cysteine protease
MFFTMMLLVTMVSAQEHLQKGAVASDVRKTFTTLKENPITSVKNQYRSGTCWDYGTLGFLEGEILRKTGKTYDLCEMFVVNKDYMDNDSKFTSNLSL